MKIGTSLFLVICPGLEIVYSAETLRSRARLSKNKNDRMGGSVVSFVTNLRKAGYLDIAQADFISQRYPNVDAEDHALVESNSVRDIWDSFEEGSSLQSEMQIYVDEQFEEGQLSQETRRYLYSLLRLSAPHSFSNQVKASYTGNGIVSFQGRIDPSPPADDFFSEERYNGIWGYATGSREYALQCHSNGLHIIDVTNPTASFRVQYIQMAGGTIWRDVETYTHGNGKTYAYVAAQSGGNLFVVDLSSLSGSTPHAEDAASCNYVDRGRKDYGHTLTARDGLLFLNSANDLGCQIFDIDADPWDPQLLTNSYDGPQKDCHDSLARNGVSVPGEGNRNLLFSSDGHTGRFRIVDITGIRSGSNPVVLGETEDIAFSTYAHSCFLSEDSNYLFVFEESNSYDIGVFDVSDARNPVLIKTFSYSDDVYGDAGVHNGQVRGDLLFVAYYEAGFRVFDIADPTNPVERGKYDTYLDPDGTGIDSSKAFYRGGFDGAWNVYSFLPSGNILVSDQKSGLFIFQVDGVTPISTPPTGPTIPSTPRPTPALTSTPPVPVPQPCTDLDLGYNGILTCDDYLTLSCSWNSKLITACCMCGGGEPTPAQPGPTTPTTPQSAPALTPTPQMCTDLDLGWHGLLTCDDYNPDDCSGWFAGSIVTACCMCGGGEPTPAEPGPTTPTTPQPAPALTPTPQMCTDLDLGWYGLLTCDDYSPDDCSDWFNDIMTACCMCGGGKITPVPGSTPSSAPLDRPTKPSPSAPGFNIQLINMGTNTRFDQAFEDAKLRWESVVTNDLEDMPARSSLGFDWFDGEFLESVNRDVDDVLIGYAIEDMDGYGGTLGFAGPIYFRSDVSGSPINTISGIMKFDSSDFSYSMSHDDATMIIMHEMGHVLGLGVYWEDKCGTECPSSYNYTCPKAMAKYRDLGLGNELLLANDGGKGSRCGHWDDDSFDNFWWSDIMTPFFDYYKDQLLSAVDLAALEDLGGYVVDYNKADDIPTNNVFGFSARSGRPVSIRPSQSFSLENRVAATKIRRDLPE